VIVSLHRRFGTIRWKLAGSYVLVSLLITLFGELLVVIALIVLLNTRIIPDALAVRANQFALSLSPEFAAAGQRRERLIARFQALIEQEQRAGQEFAGEGATSSQPQITFSTRSSDIITVLVDRDGRIVAASPSGSHPAGALLPTLEPPEIYELASNALRGITDTSQLAGWRGPDRQLVAAAPVFGGDGRVVGAVFTRSDRLPLAELVGGVALSLLIVLVPVLLISSLFGLVYGWFAGRGFSRRLNRLTEANAALAAGDLSQRVDDRSADEIGQLACQFNAMAGQLAENMRALQGLAEQNAQLAERAGQLATVEERNRLARDLHDSVSQELFSLSMLAAASRRLIENKPEVAAAQLEEIQTTAQRALQETRSLIFALRPAALDDRGLAPALRDLATAAKERQGLDIDLRISGERRLPLEHEQTLFRIVQEALANVTRHSGVHVAQVALRYEDSRVTLTVRDQGRGFDPATARNARSLGIHSMGERAAEMGGSLTVESTPDRGTTVAVTLPTPDEVKRQADQVTR
jgi:signal transduction histidine kinase